MRTRRLMTAMTVITAWLGGQALAGTLTDHFTGNSLDPAWTIITDGNVASYLYTVASSRITFSDDNPVASPVDPVPSAIDVTVQNDGHVYLTRPLPNLNDFALTFDFGWDDNAGPFAANNAMGLFFVSLLDASNNVVVEAGFRDGSTGIPPTARGTIGATQQYGTAGGLPHVSSNDQITIVRDPLGNIAINWSGSGAANGLTPMVGGNTTAVTQLRIDFGHFRFDGVDTKLGELWVDQVSISSSAIPEPASLALLALGGATLLRRKAF